MGFPGKVKFPIIHNYFATCAHKGQLSAVFSAIYYLKVVLEGYHRYFFRVKFKTVKLIGGRRSNGLDDIKAAIMPAQIIQMMAFTRIMAIWTPAITL